MAEPWRKIDEDRARRDESWSAFLLKTLVDNANAYADELAPGFAAVWNVANPPTWASMESFAGGLVTFNVGQRALLVELVLTFQHHATLAGYLQIFHPASSSSTIVTVAAGATNATIQLAFNSPQSGVQEFQVLYKSTVAETSIGHFHCFTAIGNQISVRNDSSTFTVAAHAGRQFWAVQLAGTNVDDGNPISPGGFHWYQVGRVNELVNAGGGQHADGYLITWPDVETNPPILRSTSTFVQQAPNYVQGDIFELSWIALYSVAMRVTANGASEVPMLFAHDLAQPVSMIPSAQRNRGGNQLIQAVASASSQDAFLGALVDPSLPLVKFYSQDYRGTVSLMIRFRAMAYLPAEATPEITIDLVEVAPGGAFNFLATIPVGPVLIPLARPRRSFSDADFVHLAITGVNLGEGLWGMADAALSVDLTAPPVFTTTVTFDARKWADGYAYAIQINTTSAIYLSSLFVGGD